jgi:hypothetical protein
MKTRIFAVFGTLALSVAGLSAQSSQTVTGTVTDAMCGAHHMMQGASAAECTHACVKQGSDYALASGDKVYTLKGDKTQFDKLAGQAVTVKGKVTGNTIAVESIAPTKS